ncbi:hypothetical protein HPB50_018652 [Hyalomma asiaticum]|uniref:Uncharacterized protein n=1 Tax=Hyalomma asiaticum TaxID=266040 RepID=A0ACB7SFX8_HYAAI|nr:hypothetical protein HPB50_018652 [Hyalomma asiaticum]
MVSAALPLFKLLVSGDDARGASSAEAGTAAEQTSSPNAAARCTTTRPSHLKPIRIKSSVYYTLPGSTAYAGCKSFPRDKSNIYPYRYIRERSDSMQQESAAAPSSAMQRYASSSSSPVSVKSFTSDAPTTPDPEPPLFHVRSTLE